MAFLNFIFQPKNELESGGRSAAPVQSDASEPEKTCPNCRIAASLLDKAGVGYRKVYVEDERELAESLGLKQAPTLVVNGENGVEKIVNVSNIKKYIGQ